MNGDSSNLDRRVKRSKAALKNSLISLMQTKDFKEITITDIVQLADVNRGTFYKHYQYKEELYLIDCSPNLRINKELPPLYLTSITKA